MNVLVLTDNLLIFREFKSIVQKNSLCDSFTYACSPESRSVFAEESEVSIFNVKEQYDTIIGKYDLVISCHCKKIFPAKLVKSIKCINIHPGFNPYNRGWYPQVFSINNKLPHGATIHLMDEEIDHGDILYQKEVEQYGWDTSLTLYERVVKAEIELFEENINNIMSGSYIATPMGSEGNYNSIADFKELCELDLNSVGTLSEHIDLLRSLTHGNFNNAYITIDGHKVFVKIQLQPELET